VSAEPARPGLAAALRLAGRLALIALAVGLLLPDGARAAGRLRAVRGIQVSSAPRGTAIEIDLDFPLRYLTHSPGREGTFVRIRLAPLDELGTRAELPPGRHVVQWAHGDVVPLLDVELDPDAPDGPVLLIRFTRPVQFEVSQGQNLERLRVTVLRPAAPPRATRRQSAAAGRQGAPRAEAGTTGASQAASPAQIDRMMAEVRDSMTRGDYQRASLLLTKVLSFPEHERSPEAKELLGLAHQRNGQLAHAKAEYEEYLETYPDSAGAPRVRQRLDALLTASKTPARATAEEPSPETGFNHDAWGSLSQFYRGRIRETELEGRTTTEAALDSDLFFTTRSSSDRWDIRTSFAGGYRHDFLGADLSEGSRFSSGFVETRDRVHGLQSRLGRQSSRGSGILGRFDGAVLSAELHPQWRINLNSGFPVDFTRSNRIDLDRPFYGVSLDMGTFAEHWEGQIYGIQQRIDGLEDRTAVGGELRFTHRAGFFLGYGDYDVSYRELNIATVIGNWRLGDRLSLNLLADYRRTPTLSTVNALIGQTVDEIEELEDLFTEDEIRDLAEDRTATSRMLNVGFSHQLTRTLQIGGDFTLSNLSGTPASGGVEEMPGTGNEYAYSLHTTETGLLVDGGYTTLGLRYVDADRGDRIALNTGGRYPVWGALRLGPRVIVELRRDESGEKQWDVRPSLRVDYRWRRFRFEAEAGVELTEDSASGGGGLGEERGYFCAVGTRFDF
jgi:hypothetical protein